MYIGNNNTNNFDVEPNHFYNLRTTINTDINSAKNDERIRTYSASQYVEFHASKNVSVIGGKFDTKYNASSEKYDLMQLMRSADSYPDSRTDGGSGCIY